MAIDIAPFKEELVSIVTPAYRVADIIEETIRSVVAQTYLKWEMLIADDCSPDDTAAVVERAAMRDSRIRLIRCEKNGGPAAARNAALERATGRWIAFLDSDDIWLPEKLEETLKFAVSHAAVLSYTGFRRIDFGGHEVGNYISVPDRLSYRQLLGNTSIATSTVLIDRKRAGNIVMRPVYYDDFVCWLEILKKGFVAHGLNKDLMRYRVVSDSVSRNKRRSAVEVWKTYRNVENLALLPSAWYFANYTLRAVRKYRAF